MSSRLLLSLLPLLLLLLITPAVKGQSSIDAARLVGGGTAGIVEVKLNTGEWGRLCNINNGFTNNAASAVCAMLGYRPITGYAISIPPDNTGSPTAVAGAENCNGSISASDSSTWKLEKICEKTPYLNQLPPACNSTSFDSAVSCTGTLTTSSTAAYTGTTAAPNVEPIAVTNCSTNVTNVKLLPGPTEGLVLIQNQASNTSEFGTICSIGFSSNEASYICSQLCQGTVNAVALTGQYLTEAANYSIALSGLTCPPGANSTSSCTHDGWGVATSPCSSKLAVSVRCADAVATAPSAPIPTVVCENNRAYVYFTVAQVANESLLRLDGSYDNATCGFNTTSNSTTVWAEIPYTGCNTEVSTNSTHTMYTAYLYKDVEAVNGVYYDTAYIYPIVCEVGKQQAATAQVAPNAQTAPPVSGTDSYPTDISVFRGYSSSGFSSPVNTGASLTIGSTAYLRVRTTSALSLRLVIRNCSATQTSAGTGTPYYLVVNKCATTNNEIFSVNDKTMGIKFRVMSFTSTIGPTTQAYFFCDLTVCSTTDTSERCMQSCGTATRRRRRRSAEEENAEKDTETSKGPYNLIDAIYSTSTASSDSRVSTLLVSIATAAMAAFAIA